MGFMSKFTKLRKNKEFGYQPRFYDDKGEGSPFKMEYKFDQFRSTVDNPRGIKNKFRNAMDDVKRKGDRNIRLRMTIIIAILVFIFLYITSHSL